MRLGPIAPFRAALLSCIGVLLLGGTTIFQPTSAASASVSSIRSLPTHDAPTSTTDTSEEKEASNPSTNTESSPVDQEASKARASSAQSPKTSSVARTTSETYRLLGLGGGILGEVGFSGLVRLRNEFFGIEVAAGWAPYAVVATDGCDETHVSGSLRLSGSLLAWFFERNNVSHGMRIGMMHDTFYGWGAMAGYQAEYAVRSWLILGAGAGFQLFWNGHLPAKEQMQSICTPVTPTIAYPIGGVLQPYLGMSVLFYPF